MQQTAAHLWATGSMATDDVFALQDEVTSSVVGAIQPELVQTEIELAARRRTGNLSAHDLFLRSLPHFYAVTREGMLQAQELLARALELDPIWRGCVAGGRLPYDECRPELGNRFKAGHDGRRPASRPGAQYRQG